MPGAAGGLVKVGSFDSGVRREMRSDPNSFPEVLEKARDGDRQAREELFSRFAGPDDGGDPILALARRILGPHDRARDFVESGDLVQSALRSAWVDLDAFEGGSSEDFRAWLRTILRRKLYRIVKERARSATVDPLYLERLCGPSHEAERELASQELKGKVRAAVGELPEEQREVLLLRLEGLRSPEIAAVLGLPPATVRKRESRAAARLRHLLATLRSSE